MRNKSLNKKYTNSKMEEKVQETRIVNSCADYEVPDRSLTEELKEDHNSNVDPMDKCAHKANGMDKGWAWAVLIACFLNRLQNDGLSGSLGVFLVVLQDQFPGSVTNISWIISLAGGGAYVVGPIGSALCKKFSIRQVVMASTILTSFSFIAASFATRLWHLYVTFALAGTGLGLGLQPVYVILTYYFDKQLASANGVASAGVAVGVFALPPFFQIIIDNFGWQGALLIIASLVGNMCVCAAIYRPTALEIESRNQIHPFEPKQSMTEKRKANGCENCVDNCMAFFNLKLLMNVRFILLLFAYFVAGVAYVIAVHYLPARAVHVGIPDIKAACLVSVTGICSFVSRVTYGYVIDNHISATVFTATAFFMLAIITALNPVTDNYTGLVILSVMSGLSSGVCYTSFPIVAKEYVGVHHVSGAVGLILLVIGAGVFLGSYLTGVLVDATNSYDIPFYMAGGCFLLCSLFIFVHPLMSYLRPQDENATQNSLQGQDNFVMEMENKNQDNPSIQEVDQV